MMKHSLIALAALAAVGSAAAQSSVTLYGVVDTGYEVSKNVKRSYNAAGVQTSRTSVRTAGMTSGTLSGSRWGLKGEEALGNGLSAVFNIEAGFESFNSNVSIFTTPILDIDGNTVDVVTGINGLDIGFNRRSVVGLKGSFGTVVVGRDSTPLDNWGFDIDGSTKGDVGYTEKYSGLFYSGEFSGVSINAMLGGEKSKTTQSNLAGSTTIVSSNTTAYGLGAAYNNGPIGVGGAVQQVRDRVAGSTSTEFGIGGSYDFGPAKIFSHYMSSKNRVTGGAYSRWEHANVGVSAAFGSLTVMAEYGRNRVKAVNDGTRLGDYAALAASFGNDYRVSGNGNNFVLGANYALSKRTDLYARAGRKASLNANVSNATTGAHLGSFKGYNNYVNFGLRHVF